VSNRIKAADHDKKVEISNALEMLAPIVAPLEYLVLAALNLTGIQLFSELSFLTVNALFKAETGAVRSNQDLQLWPQGASYIQVQNKGLLVLTAADFLVLFVDSRRLSCHEQYIQLQQCPTSAGEERQTNGKVTALAFWV
jgi:hypothetical protein